MNKKEQTYTSFADATRMLLESRAYITSHVAPTKDGGYVVKSNKDTSNDKKR